MTLGLLAERARMLAADSRERIQAAGAGDTGVVAVTHDSRAVTPGTIFVAVRGLRTDGAAFAPDAIRRGAAAVVAESPAPAGLAVAWLHTANARLALADLADILYAHPSGDLTLVGVTGTNGKTTSAYLLASVFDAAGLPSGRMGTVTVRVGPSPADESDAAHTTPEAGDIQRLLRTMLTRGCKACAMEVSSHARVLERVAFLRFAAAIFTNLTRDHLDFHGDMQQYFAAKRRLFEMLPPDAPSIVNVDDPRGVELAASLPRVMTYAVDRPADVRPSSIESSLEGLAFDIETPTGRLAIRSPLVGRPNVYNILGVVAAATSLGLPAAAIERGIAGLDTVPGRFQMV